MGLCVALPCTGQAPYGAGVLDKIGEDASARKAQNSEYLT